MHDSLMCVVLANHKSSIYCLDLTEALFHFFCFYRLFTGEPAVLQLSLFHLEFFFFFLIDAHSAAGETAFQL